MSCDEQRLPASVLRTQQSGHDMMPINVRLPFCDVRSSTDDFLVTVILTCMCACLAFSLRSFTREKERNPTNYSIDDHGMSNLCLP